MENADQKVPIILCQNCGHLTTRNFCAECGQKTALHKDTFIKMFLHFIGDYFHYDSKFWKSLSALFFSPGKLTLAYWSNKRMKYIQPIPFYIFVSAVFFLSGIISSELDPGTPPESVHLNAPAKTYSGTLAPVRQKLRSRLDLMINDTPEGNEFTHKMVGIIPKVFFFMIPCMGAILSLLFFKRRKLFFVDHSVFSLHYHTFFFAAFTLLNIPFLSPQAAFFPLAILVGAGIYFVIALKRVYAVGWLRSVLYTLIVGGTYSIVFLFILFSLILFL